MLTTTRIHTLAAGLADEHAMLIQATKEVFEASEAALVAKLTLKDAEQAIINQHADDPKALGLNEKARDAAIAEMTTDERAALFHAECAERQARARRDVAQLKVNALQDSMRLLELESKGVE